MPPEPKIQIGEWTLSEAQAMAVRVAVTNFHMEVSDPEFAAELGPISGPYKDRLAEVLRIMLAGADR